MVVIMRKNKIIYIYFILIIFILINLTGCNNDMTNEDIKTKVTQELNYLDTQIISIANKLNNITMQNYTITSEEITLGEQSSNKSSGDSSSSGGESTGGESSGGGSSGGESSRRRF